MKTTKRISLLLIFVILLVPMLSLYSCDESKYHHTVVGEVEFVCSGFDYHIVYVRPIDQEDHGIWIPLKVSGETQTISEFSIDLKEMPELAVGTAVEVKYSIKAPREKDALLSEYEAVSVKVFDNSFVVENQYVPFKLTDGYEYSWSANTGTRDKGTVVHIAKLDAPISGYIIYLTGRFVNDSIKMYWLDEEALGRDGGISIPAELQEKIEARQTGYEVAIHGLKSYPFEGFNMESVLSIDFYDPNYHW